MSLRTALLSLAIASAISAQARAGTVVFDATGTVSSFNGAGLTQFPGMTSGGIAHLRFEVNTPGTVRGLGTNYAIDMPTFGLTIGSTTKGLSTAANVLMQDLPDGIRLFSAPLVGGPSLDFEFGASNNLMFTAADPLQSIGSWSGIFYTSFAFTVAGAGTFIDIDLNTFSIAVVQTGTPYCFGDGSGTACPCGNASAPAAMIGCVNGASTGGKLRGSGVASVSADTFVLSSSGGIPFGPGLYFQGSTQITAGVAFGNGLLCLTGATPRLEIRFADGTGAASSTVSISQLGAVSGGDVRGYQMWYRDTTGFCTGAGFNLTNAIGLTWAP